MLTAIIKNTFQEGIRNRLFIALLLVVASFILFMLIYLNAEITTNVGGQIGYIAGGEKAKSAVGILYRFGLFIGVVTQILISMRGVGADLGGGGGELILTKPVRRYTYLLGKILGNWLSVAFFILLCFIFVELLSFLILGELVVSSLIGFLVLSFTLLLVTALIYLFSLFLNPIVSGMFTVMVYFLSYFLNADVVEAYFFRYSVEELARDSIMFQIFGPLISSGEPGSTSKLIYSALYFLVPPFGNLSSAGNALAHLEMPLIKNDVWALAVGLVQLAVISFLLVKVFSKRDL